MPSLSLFAFLALSLLLPHHTMPQTCPSYPSTQSVLTSSHFISVPSTTVRRMHTVTAVSPTTILFYGGLSTASRRQAASDPTIYAYAPLSPTPFTAIPPSTTNPSPPPRFGHTALPFPPNSPTNSILVINGFTQDYESSIFRVTTSPNATWSRVNSTSPSPGVLHASYGHATAVLYSDATAAIVAIFAGTTTGGSSTNALTVTKLTHDTATDIVTSQHYNPTTNTPPDATSSSAFTAATNGAGVMCMYVHGGIDTASATIHSSLYSFCPTEQLTASTDLGGSNMFGNELFEWTSLVTHNKTFQPVPRYGAILAALTPGKVLLHGGTGSWPHLYMQNTAEYDTSMNVWTDLSGKIGATESTRFHAATILNSTDLYIFAGEAAASSVDLTFKTNVTSASCPSGHATEYCMETTSVVCRPCPAGTYAPPNVVSYVCTDCASGSYNPDVTQDVCVECPKGKHGTGSDGAADGTHCVDCSAGRYSNAFKAPSSSSCGICTSGSFSSLAAWNCTSCDAGTSSTAESETCGACPSGKYSSAAAPECIDCDPGYHQPSPSSSSCDICVAGTASPTASADCTDCDAGYYSSSDGASECTACDPGTYQTAAAQAECDDCVVGKKSSATAATSSGTCSKCSKGKFGASTGLSSCSDCVAGKHQDRKGQESCDDCEFGKYSTAVQATSATTCVTCPVGTFTAATGSPSLAACNTCPPGKYSLPNEGEGCQLCPRGRYTSTQAMAQDLECSRCDRNTFSSHGATTCTACGANAFSHLGYSTCIPCSADQTSADLEYSGSLQHFYLADEIIEEWEVPAGASYGMASDGPAGATTGVLIVPHGESSNPTTDVPLNFAVAMPVVLRGFVRRSSGSGSIDLSITTADDSSSFTHVLSIPYDSSDTDWQFLTDTFYPFPSQVIISARVELAHVSSSGSAEWAGVGLFNHVAGSCGCGEGFYLNLDTPNCRTCTDQPSCRSALAECYRCPAGHYCGAGIMMSCGSGQFSWGGSLNCDDCEPGWICENGLALPCASDGSVESAGVCVGCPPGFNCRNGEQFECLPGTYSAGGNGVAGKQCIPCEPGTYAATSGATKCDDCAPGTTSNHGYDACSYCGENLYTAGFGEFPCLSCGGNTSTGAVGPTYLLESGSYGATSSTTGAVVGNFEADEGEDNTVTGWFIAPKSGSYKFTASGGRTAAVNVSLAGEEVEGVQVGLLEGQWYELEMSVVAGRQPDYSWDFKNCVDDAVVVDSEGGVTATPGGGGGTCGAEGINFAGDGYMELDSDFEWGGDVSFELRVKYDQFGYLSRVFDFSDDGEKDNVMLYNKHATGSVRFAVKDGDDEELYEVPTTFEKDVWAHFVISADAGGYKVYKDGVLVGSHSAGNEVNVVARNSQLIGAKQATGSSSKTNFFEGTVEFLRMWVGGGVLEAAEVSALHTAASGGGGGGGKVKLGWEDADGVASSELAMEGLMVRVGALGGCPLRVIESVAWGGGCAWGAVGAAEVAATVGEAACDGSSVRCLNGTLPGDKDCFGIPFYDEGCGEDSAAWFQKGNELGGGKGCAWVGEAPKSRCAVTNDDNVFAWEACRQSCYCCDSAGPCAAHSLLTSCASGGRCGEDYGRCCRCRSNGGKNYCSADDYCGPASTHDSGRVLYNSDSTMKAEVVC